MNNKNYENGNENEKMENIGKYRKVSKKKKSHI